MSTESNFFILKNPKEQLSKVKSIPESIKPYINIQLEYENENIKISIVTEHPLATEFFSKVTPELHSIIQEEVQNVVLDTFKEANKKA